MVLWMQILHSQASHSNCMVSAVMLCLTLWASALDVLPQKEAYTPDYNFYHNLSNIERELDKIVEENPYYIKYHKEYRSRKGKPQLLIQVSNFLTERDKDEDKVKILFSFGEHAREFFPVESLFFLLHQLLQLDNILKYEDNQKFIGKKVLNFIDLYIIVMGNPDGRIYVEQSKNYCWRGTSAGVDINRNFDWEFGGKGSSNNKKDEEYRGPHAFSGKNLKET